MKTLAASRGRRVGADEARTPKASTRKASKTKAGRSARPSLRAATRAALAGTSGSADFLPHGCPGLGPLGAAGETPHAVPLFQVTNFSYPDAHAADEAAAGRGFLYARHGNPTVAALEAAMADLEGAEAALAFGSGMGALAGALDAFTGAGELLASEGIYGGSTELLVELARRHGATARFVPAWDVEQVAASLRPNTRMLLVETLSNPLLRIVDLPALARLCRARDVALVVDATTSSPIGCRPIAHGATLVVHSLSKYVGGHGDILGGVVSGDAKAMARVRRQRTVAGAVLDPFAAWLALRGLRTLPVRYERQCTTAAKIARLLARHPAVRAVHYPALPGHPDRALARRLFSDGDAPSALVSFALKNGTAARRFYDRVRLISRAASFGETTSLLTHPATFSHKGLTPAERARLGIDDNLLRLSVGLEDAADLADDIKQALARL
ncbi:MAG TPA: aminotransferase class I/II-fold pyridoxal phosphate-dependent enzyme [Polyangia bacterium]